MTFLGPYTGKDPVEKEAFDPENGYDDYIRYVDCAKAIFDIIETEYMYVKESHW